MSRFMLKTGGALMGTGHEVRYLFRDELAPTTVRGGIRRLIIPWLVVWRILRRDRGDCDIVEIHEPLAAAYSLLRRCRRLRIPKCLVVSYGTEERCWRAQRQRWQFLGVKPPLKSRLLVPPTLLWQSRFGLRNSDHVMVPNDTDEQYVRDELGVPGERVTRVNTGVGDEFFAVPRNDERAFAALFVGSWIDRKGTRELSLAWSELATSQPDVTLTIVGTGRTEHQVRQSFARRVQDRIRVRPVVSQNDLLAELQQHSVFVLPSWCEGMPLATLEAAAAGLACVVSSIPGHVEIFRPTDPESDGALLVPASDAKALRAALLRLASSRALIRTLGANARQRARSFTWRHTAEQSRRAYARALAS